MSRTRSMFLFPLAALAALALAGCSGSDGSDGKQGPPGEPGVPGDPAPTPTTLTKFDDPPGVVFGITFIRMYSSDDAGPEGTTDTKAGGKTAEQPLKFFTVKAIVATPESTPKHLWYWDPEVEVGEPGHFEFWCQNRHPQSVTLRVPTTNCVCAGVGMAVVPPDAYRDYLIGSALAGGPLCPAPGPAAVLAHLGLERRLAWVPLYKDHERLDQTIPAADANTGPQFTLVRLAWTGKGESGRKGISAELYASLGDGTPSHTQLGVETNVVPAFALIRRNSETQWSPSRDVVVGDLRENGVSTHTVYMSSSTRSFLLPTIESDKPDPCLTWTEPVPASDEELASARQFKSGEEQPMRRIKCLYKTQLTIRERVEVEVGGRKVMRQLDLGAFDRKLTVAAANGGSWPMRVQGQVLGDVKFLAGAEGGRIELGTSFPVDQDRSRDVVILAERAGLEFELAEGEVVPNYLKVKLEELEPIGGQHQYRLRVTVPKNTLFGSLPEDSVVVLKTKGPTPRRLRFPVRGMTYDSGGPKL